MDNTSAKLFAAEIDDRLPVLDLHGLYPEDALTKLDVFLYENFNKQIQAVRIIYGAGTGRLKEEVLIFLFKHGLVEECKDEGGSAVVILSETRTR